MKVSARTLALIPGILGINFILAPAAICRFAPAQTRQVPIARLLRNIEYQRSDKMTPTDRAMVDFRIGRLHAMAYAQNVETAACDVHSRRGSHYELPDFGHEPDHIQFKISSPNKNSAAAKDHLNKAIQHLEKASKIDPGLYTARLGLAWCLEQSGNKSKALEMYREIFAHTFEGEKNAKGGPSDWSIAEETAIYLKPLLDPVKDRQDLDRVKREEAQLAKLPHYVTPLMVPLTSGLRLKDLLVKHRVHYDLDGFGVREYSEWISPRAAWVVLNRDGKGNIDSGIKLIGQSSFWIFWQNAYDVLKGLDDNHDGQLTGRELDGIALWQDKNTNGISERGEIISLAQLNVRSLNVAAEKNSTGLLWNSQGVKLRNGQTLPSYDVVLRSSDRRVANTGRAFDVSANDKASKAPHRLPALQAKVHLF